MKKMNVTLPEIGLIAATRGMLGAGLALLLADRLSDDQRKTLGWTLMTIGAVSTIPLAIQVLRSDGRPEHAIPANRAIPLDREDAGSWIRDRGLD